MSTSVPPAAIQKIRTYAADLNFARTKSNPAKSTVVREEETNVPSTTKNEVSENVIPPFHSFSKAASAKNSDTTPLGLDGSANPQAAAQKIIQVNSKISESGTSNEALPAVIITDTKSKRFNLGSALVGSVTDWWNKKELLAKQKKTPRYTVQQAERRKGIIQKATAKSGRTASADHEAVVSRIKATKQIPHATNDDQNPSIKTVPDSTSPVIPAVVQRKQIVKKPTAERVIASPTFSSYISESPNWETDIQANVNALTKTQEVTPSKIVITGKEFTKIKQTRAAEPTISKAELPVTHINPLVTPKITPVIPTLKKVTPVVTPVVVHNSPAKAISEDVLPKSKAPTFTQYSRPKITPVIPMTTTRVAVEPTEIIPVQVDIPEEAIAPKQKPAERRFAPPRETKNSKWFSITQTNRVAYVVLGLFIFVVGGGLAIRSYQNAPSKSPTSEMPVTNTAFTESSLQTQTTVYSDKYQLGERLREQAGGVDSLIEVTFVNEIGVTLTAAEFLTLFDITVPFDFSASLNDIRFGTYRGDPWILLTTSDRNTALGGMLAWETSMARTLSPLFSNEGETINSKAAFSDSIIDTKDVRIIKNEAGDEEIVYGFITSNTIVITSNTSAFLNLAQKIY